MPYTTNPTPNSHQPSDPLPDHLAHKPVYAMPYEDFDGHYADTADKKTDIRYISIGTAQYDSDHVSVKTMRYTGEKWTRQAEELPLHRVLDMALFVAKVLLEAGTGAVEIPAGTFHNQTNTIHITPEHRSYGEMASFNRFVEEHLPLYKERLSALYEVLTQLKKEEKI